MREINFSADELVSVLLGLENEHKLCLLDSCGVSHLGSHLLIAGIDPVEVLEINQPSADETLAFLDKKLRRKDLSAMMTISYDFGLKLNKLQPRPKEFRLTEEPDIFLALFDVLIVHDYDLRKTFLIGNLNKFDEIERVLIPTGLKKTAGAEKPKIRSNFTRTEYLEAVEKVQEYIRRGHTYQTNLTQQICAELPENLKPEQIFATLRKKFPAPFSAFFRRENDVVISASPERFFKVQNAPVEHNPQHTAHNKIPLSNSKLISVSPIKGTRPRGNDVVEDLNLQNELLNSEKDRAENVMIVDLLRNDIGRICEYGSVRVEKICELETYPTLFHLVSTISGLLRENIELSDILRAVFPCGSITGAPKIRTMQIIDELENASRGLSMGAIGYVIPQENAQWSKIGNRSLMDFSVAIRTMTIRGRQAVFNVGGGITIDSIPSEEYDETLVKARALLKSLNHP